MSLYRKYRPEKFNDLVGQDHVRRTLANAVVHDEVAHAYLFSGSRGIGKTSAARILAMALNCTKRKAADSEPCGTCDSCQSIKAGRSLNVVEIDAASNRGIDEIRSLKEAIAVSSGSKEKKVYIIDEVHMLTKEAFNALLKTLEEPPAQIVFVLATTELHRVPDTIISRVQHFSFKRASLEDIARHLQFIAKKEGLEFDPGAIELMTIHADGGFRDALTLLDQLQALGESVVSAESVRLALGIAPEQALIDSLTAALIARDHSALKEQLDQFVSHGYDPGNLIDSMIDLLRSGLWAAYGIELTGSEAKKSFAQQISATMKLEEICGLIERLLVAKQQLRWSILPMLPIELALLYQSDLKPQSAQREPVSKVAAKKTSASSKSPTEQPEPLLDPKPAKSNKESEKRQPVFADSSNHDLAEVWAKVTDGVREQNASFGALLRACAINRLEDKTCYLEVPFSFYADRISDRKNGTILKDLLSESLGGNYEIKTELRGATEPSDQSESTVPPDSRSDSRDLMGEVKEIFGVAS